MSQLSARRPSEHYALTWRGIPVRIHYHPDAFGSGRSYHVSHLEIECPRSQQLPITDTGYKSHYTLAGTIESAGGPVVYVNAWLDAAARSASWRTYELVSRQGSLF